MATTPAAKTCTLHISLLGGIRLDFDGKRMPFSVRPKVIPLFAHLLLHAERTASRDELAFLIWPDDTEDAARANLRRHLLYLREALPPGEWIVADGDGVRWNADAPAETDVAAFERDVARRETRVAGVARYVGDLLPSLDEEWVIGPRERLRAVFQETLWQLAGDARRRRDGAGAREYLQRLLTSDPWREDAVRELMLVRYESGDRAGALGAFSEFVRRLRDEIGADPMPESLALRDAIASGTPLPRPSAPHNLPAPVSSFVGREAELEHIGRLLRDNRLVTLVGPGGVGKTRTALLAAAELREDFDDGVWFVDLAVIADPDAVASAIARTLGVRVTGDGDLEAVCRYLADRRLLLVVDNCEHVVAAAAAATDAMLREARGVCVLATSRETLGLTAEHVYRMPSLSMPRDGESLDAERALRYDAIALFCARAGAVSGFVLTDADAASVTNVCRRLDGIPLAIELAAARTKLLSPAELERTLDERLRVLAGSDRAAVPRQRTMRASIDWSYGLLAPRERLLFDRLSVFSGFSLDDAARICCDEELPEASLLDTLESLADKSLVSVDRSSIPTRYAMLESTREYGLERLAERGEERAMRERHARGFLALAQALDTRFDTTPDRDWMVEADLSQGNWIAAMSWSLGAPDGDRDVARRILCTRAPWADNAARPRRWLTLALEGIDENTDPSVAASLWLKRAAGLSEGGRFEEGAAMGRRAIDAAVRAGDRYIEALARQVTGVSLIFGGSVAEGESFVHDAVAAMRQLDRPESLIFALVAAAQGRRAAGDRAGSRAILLEAEGVAAGLSNKNAAAELAAASVSLTLADSESMDGGSPERALERADHALHVYRRLLNRAVPNALVTKAGHLIALGRHREAVAAAAEALQLGRETPDELASRRAIQRIAAAVAGSPQQPEADLMTSAELLGFVLARGQADGGLWQLETAERARAHDALVAVLGEARASAGMASGAAFDADRALAAALRLAAETQSRRA
jgi:predicted ATPase/DNA-binding SARP family transcriptional activator